MRVANLDIDIPEAWEDKSLYTFIAPPQRVGPRLVAGKAVFRTNVVFQQRRLEENEDLAACVERARVATEKTFGEVTITFEDGPSTESLASRRLRYTVFDHVTEQSVGQVLYVCVVGDVEWQVAFSVAALTLREALPEFDRVVASIRIADDR